jgi:ubiquinone/menaquinone biosynthesis C-methylase UbiE
MKMNSNLWEAGDFARIAPGAQIIGEVLCDVVPVYAGDRVLDIGCGTGNTALAAARRRARVTGVDPVEKLLNRARERTRFEGLEIEYHLSGAEALPFVDESFDVALSTFGLIFSEDATASVSESARVLRPGGCLALTSWASTGMNYRLFEICAQACPTLASVSIAQKWGTESFAVEQLAQSFASVQIEKKIFYPRAHSVGQWLEGMKQFLAPVFLAYQNACAAEALELDRQFLALADLYNRNPEHGFFAHVDYLEIICRKA